MIETSLSGLQGASMRLANSANNIANVNSTSSITPQGREGGPFVPNDITQAAIEPTGGVETNLRARDPAERQMFDPTNPASDENGVVALPNVDMADEAVEQIIARNSFQGNLSALRAEMENQESLLDMAA